MRFKCTYIGLITTALLIVILFIYNNGRLITKLHTFTFPLSLNKETSENEGTFTNIKTLENKETFTNKETSTNKEATKIRYLIGIINRHNDFEKRTIVRQLWMNRKLIKRQDFIMKFLVGKPIDAAFQTLVEEENEIHKDIVVLNATEQYELLMEKTLKALKWFIDHSNETMYSNIKYFIKVDDDFVLFVDNLLERLDNFDVEYYGNLVEYQPVIREVGSRYYVPPELYGEKYFQPYASGACYVLQRKTVFTIYDTSLKITHFRNEDAFIGYLALKSNISIVDDRRFHSFDQLTDDSVEYVCSKRGLFGIHYSTRSSFNRQQIFFYRFIHNKIPCQ